MRKVTEMTEDELAAAFADPATWASVSAQFEPATTAAPQWKPQQPPATLPAGTPTTQVTIRVPNYLLDFLDSLAELDGARRSDLFRVAVAQYIRRRATPLPNEDEVRAALDILGRAALAPRDHAA